jgi:hypothetical protein
MTQSIGFNRVLRAVYPSVVFLFIVLSWSTTGQGGNPNGLPKFPSFNEISWRRPTNLQNSCGQSPAKTPNAKETSCRADQADGSLKQLGKNQVNESQGSSSSLLKSLSWPLTPSLNVNP